MSSSDNGDEETNQHLDNEVEEEEEDKNLDYDSIEDEPKEDPALDSDHDAIYEAYNDNNNHYR